MIALQQKISNYLIKKKERKIFDFTKGKGNQYKKKQKKRIKVK